MCLCRIVVFAHYACSISCFCMYVQGRRKWYSIRIKTPLGTLRIPFPIDAEWSNLHPHLAAFISTVIVIGVFALIAWAIYLHAYGSNNSDHLSKHSS